MLARGQTRSAKFLANFTWVLDLEFAFESRRRAGNIRKCYFTALANSARLPLRLAYQQPASAMMAGMAASYNPFQAPVMLS